MATGSIIESGPSPWPWRAWGPRRVPILLAGAWPSSKCSSTNGAGSPWKTCR